MKARMFVIAFVSIGSIFTLLVVTGQATRAETVQHVMSISSPSDYTNTALESISLRNTTTLTFTPVSTVYLPIIAKAYPCFIVDTHLYQNNDPLNKDGGSHSSATRVDTFTVTKEIQGLTVTLSLCSQSMTNYTQNSVVICFIKDGNEIACKEESYNSESQWGTPIPCYNHVLNFPDIWLTDNESINISTTVTSGDYKNFLVEENVWGGFCAIE